MADTSTGALDFGFDAIFTGTAFVLLLNSLDIKLRRLHGEREKWWNGVTCYLDVRACNGPRPSGANKWLNIHNTAVLIGLGRSGLVQAGQLHAQLGHVIDAGHFDALDRVQPVAERQLDLRIHFLGALELGARIGRIAAVQVHLALGLVVERLRVLVAIDAAQVVLIVAQRRYYLAVRADVLAVVQVNVAEVVRSVRVRVGRRDGVAAVVVAVRVGDDGGAVFAEHRGRPPLLHVAKVVVVLEHEIGLDERHVDDVELFVGRKVVPQMRVRVRYQLDVGAQLAGQRAHLLEIGGRLVLDAVIRRHFVGPVGSVSHLLLGLEATI